ncbi:E3 ubiquitin-protein ligase rnf213-alpha-like [Mytilus californianus]|uniref:E3 ubiquitin-protein ligase rnf213-alpha-like n=1 Tax=Mytilus californianus TaxID=6549 RepID=UPI0022461256|nr:E3 ubiquitin-protein ligase rnf213-alpha-like [Mytilus californianus]
MQKSIAVMQTVCQNLITGNITMQNLKNILSAESNFKSILKEIKDLKVDMGAVKASIDLRRKQLLAFESDQAAVLHFVYICENSGGNIGVLTEKLKQFENMATVQMKDICVETKIVMHQIKCYGVHTVQQDQFELLSSHEPIITAFGFSKEQMCELKNIIDYTKGGSFVNFLTKQGKKREKSKNRKLSVNEVLNDVWEPAKKQWQNLYTKLQNGEMLFSVFEKYYLTDDLDTLHVELTLFNKTLTNVSWIDERICQFKQYKTICECSKGAKAILNLVGEYQLKGSFRQIKEIDCLARNADTTMATLDKEMLRTCNTVREINMKRASCLAIFTRCKDLIMWLRESIHTMKDWNTFIELASMSSRQGDLAIARVHSLHASVTGYGPLIYYDVNWDENAFLTKCKQVWKVMETDSKLPNKLLGTYENLEWLKSVKKAHGSLEVDVLSQAETLNAKGVYKIGYSGGDTQLKKLELTDVITLSYSDENQRRNAPSARARKKTAKTAVTEVYDFKRLQSLQSLLMLVAGKAEKENIDIERFTMILDAVVRLSNVYIKLISNGCVLFAKWHATFICDENRPVCAFLTFGQGSDAQTLKGQTGSTDNDVGFIIQKTANFLEECNERWLSYINEKREKFYWLNYFTIDQIVFLQQELVRVTASKVPSVFTYPMLSAVKQDCTNDNLLIALYKARNDINAAQTRTSIDTTQSVGGLQNEPGKNPSFLKMITDQGYPVAVATEALKHCGDQDLEEALVWCEEHEPEFNTKPSSNGSMQSEDNIDNEAYRGYTGWIQSPHSMESMTEGLVHGLGMQTEENAFELLHTALKELWEKFLNSISSGVSDYLSIEHLGLILKRLAEQETVTIERSFLPFLRPGEPNLLLCNQSEIYNTVLSVYMYNHGPRNDMPLPQSDEVLLCTQDTTLDMVEVFWRRSLLAENSKIFCLVNAENLDYDIADKAERKLQTLITSLKNKGTMYKLVIVCCTNSEKKSVIVRSLSKFYRPNFRLPSLQKINQYLLRMLKIIKSGYHASSAAVVDFDGCTVRVVKSNRAGVGKTLYQKRMVAELTRKTQRGYLQRPNNLTIPLHSKSVNVDEIMEVLLKRIFLPGNQHPTIFHFDISSEVQDGVDSFLFQLLVLGSLTTSYGYVWRKSVMDYYIIESLNVLVRDPFTQGRDLKYLHNFLQVLPHVMCRSPKESLIILRGRRPPDFSEHDRLFDTKEYQSSIFQIPYKCLKGLDVNNRSDADRPINPDDEKKNCLLTLLRYCGVEDPSWSELHHFVSFLNAQLQDFKVSVFCSAAAQPDLPGFQKFVLRFLIQMSRDFSTRSLAISEESPTCHVVSRGDNNEDNDDIIQQYQIRHKWEARPHPYLFFNPDHHSMTFLGFYIDKATGNLIDQQTGKILEQNIMDQNLFESLKRNDVNLEENFDALPRQEKIVKLCQVMGLENAYDPDVTYELTTDNVKKILAIHMRFRCDIPVIIMGETGCGKTRLVKYMCSLQQPPGVDVQNMILMKVHGGTTGLDIIRKVKQAEDIARKNSNQYDNMDTVLFFDEANTTEAIGFIKEIMCDKTLDGNPVQLHKRLKIVAACNPYKKHSPELIKRLEQAGLGYHVDTNATTDKLGQVPMRNLVYRVQPLPQSLLPLVWDFGQLDTNVEQMYIKQMVLRYVYNNNLPRLQGLETVVSKILTASQSFMRSQKDECSFVSLRDVERVLKVMSWFYQQSKDTNSMLFSEIKKRTPEKQRRNVQDGGVFGRYLTVNKDINDVTRSLVLALGVCYHSCLKKRKEYREHVSRYFVHPLPLPGKADQIKEEIEKCQLVFVENMELAPNIAKNQALKENVFLMVICIELKIPMFLVGKPGSSKSLAKTLVSDAMQGNAAHCEFYKSFKQVQIVSFQCSPLSTPDGILGTFEDCASYQKDKNLDKFVSVVVLDEIGLAEDSSRMPLKTLHPLLEDGCLGDEKPEPHKKVAFIGISNWALDPAKMNRGIFVQRDVPDIEELLSSAHKICSTDEFVQDMIHPMIEPLAMSYLKVFDEAAKAKREFYGLRDFYSLLKMLYGFISTSRKKPTWFQLQHCILRNFGGLPEEIVKPVDIFSSNLAHLVITNAEKTEFDPECSPTGMIQACLQGSSQLESETRYLLLLTENYGALTILQQKIFSMDNAEVVFGSSFPSDQEYTQVCRNINRIKVCMETGTTVILLNLENLYESLYDALNQYYIEFCGERFVDLGLGTHRVKCRVHKDFRLIVVAEKHVVYEKFPIPLINRLEKHFLSMNTMLTGEQIKLTNELTEWAKKFSADKSPPGIGYRKIERKIGDAFIGYHADTCSAVIHHICEKNKFKEQEIYPRKEQILNEAKSTLLWCAAPAFILQNGQGGEMEMYAKKQQHENLAEYLCTKLKEEPYDSICAQITTNSRIFAASEVEELCESLSLRRENVTVLTLQQFHTEQQFSRKIKLCADRPTSLDSLLLVQCESGEQNTELIACASYSIQRELKLLSDDRTKIHVVILVQLPGIARGLFTGHQCGLWQSVHIDDIRISKILPSVFDMYGKSAGEILSDGKQMDKLGSGTLSSEKQSNELEMMIRRQTYEHDISFKQRSIGSAYTLAFKKKDIDVNQFVMSCIHPALASLRDVDTDIPRTTERLKILSTTLEDASVKGQKLLNALAQHTTRIIREREESNERLSKNWLSVEACKLGNINRAGTFRKYANQYLESKVVPVLAGIISFIDTNRNLDILIMRNLHEWQSQLWLRIFADVELTGLKYSTIVSPKQHHELKEVEVKTTSKSGRAFSSVLPFSWLMFRQIDEILTNTRESVENKDDCMAVVLKASAIFQALPLGQLLLDLQNIGTQEILKSYYKDFINMVYPVQSEVECDLICESIDRGCRKMLRGEYGRLLSTMFGCHLVFNIYATRFSNFSHIVCVWQDCSKTMLEFMNDNHNCNLVTSDEVTLDVLGLQLLIEELKPLKDTLNKAEPRYRWLQKVCLYRAVIERIFGHFSQVAINKEFSYGERCQVAITEARFNWTKTIIVKLFIENVCISNDADSTEVIRLMALWSKLGDKADMKTLKTFETVEDHLKTRNEKVLRQYFGVLSQCLACDRVITCDKDSMDLPVKLPCKDTYCYKCYIELIADRHQCQNCNAKIPQNFSPEEIHDRETLSKYKNFRRRCNNFFMEVVSQLCFAEGTPPSQEIIKKLLSYIVGQSKRGTKMVTKELTVFQDSIDPTPVVRSFLLQHLLQTSGENVKEYLSMYFESTKQLVQNSGKQEELIDLCLLILQCMEDSIYQQYHNTHKVYNTAANMLRNASRTLSSIETGVLEKIEDIAKTKFAMSVVASCVHVYNGMADKNIVLTAEEKRLFESAGKLCEECHFQWPRKYFVKLLCRQFGIDMYQAVLARTDLDCLKWTRLPELIGGEVSECQDRYIVCGNNYKVIRETLVTAAINQNDSEINKILNPLAIGPNVWQTRVMVILALHREVTMKCIFGQEKQFPPQGICFLKEYMRKHALFQQKDFPVAVIGNVIWNDPSYNVCGNMNLTEQNIACMLVHYRALLIEFPVRTTVLVPLMNIAFNPQTMINSYYPTMPHDEIAYVREALLDGRTTSGENPVMYKCPNGHPYVVGDCGRPTVETKCRVCNARIGGHGHAPVAGNKKDEGIDRTSIGHILGRATTLGQKLVIVQDRKIDRISVAFIRLLTHISMFLGANNNVQAIIQTIKLDKKLSPNEVLPFIKEHIALDLQALQKILGKSNDDVCVFVHCILKSIMDQHVPNNTGENIPPDMCQLLSKDGRLKWEEKFASRYIAPLLKDLDRILQTHNTIILKDKRLGSDRLLQLLYETDKQTEKVNIRNLHSVPAVWRYRAHVSVDHLTQILNASQHKCPLLRIFLEEEPFLRVLRFVPSILKLQQILIQKYNRKLDRSEGTFQINFIKEDLAQERRSEEFKSLLSMFIEAWECVRQSLESYTCTVNENIIHVSTELCRRCIDLRSPVSVLLPTLRDDGLCSYLMLRFLLEKQNNFLQKFCQEKGQRLDSLPKVNVKDISSAHLISYHPEKDLLPMVLANCNYSFEVGQGTKVDYDFSNLERQLIDRFLFSKSIITDIKEITTFTYRSESTNASMFEELSLRIKQTRINNSVHSQICGELQVRSYTDLCESLDKLDIAVKFLKSVGTDPESCLSDFMTKTLKMDNPFPSQKAQQFIKLENTLFWWITLSLERCRLQHNYHQDAFEGISDTFKNQLNYRQTALIKETMNRLSVEHINAVLIVVFECIMMKLDRPDSDGFADISLHDMLYGYIDASPYEEDTLVDDILRGAIQTLQSDRNDIHRINTGHAVTVWKLINEILKTKQLQRM